MSMTLAQIEALCMTTEDDSQGLTNEQRLDSVSIGLHLREIGADEGAEVMAHVALLQALRMMQYLHPYHRISNDDCASNRIKTCRDLVRRISTIVENIYQQEEVDKQLDPPVGGLGALDKGMEPGRGDEWPVRS